VREQPNEHLKSGEVPTTITNKHFSYSLKQEFEALILVAQQPAILLLNTIKENGS